jgi:hydrogenase-4 component B
MGGLARRMPWTAGLFLLGSVAICGLPPLNGFVSELLVYLGLARSALVPGSAWVALPAPALAATGALAVACFVKVFGVVFLGTPRSAATEGAHESPALMLAPMAVLGAACVLIGAAPLLVAPALGRAVEVWAGGPLPGQSLAGLAPLGWVSMAAAALLVGTAVVLAAVVPACRRARLRQPQLATWGCGYAGGSARLQYTASSFAQLITARFAWVLLPKVHQPRIDRLFPAPTHFHSHVDDTVLDVLLPAAGTLGHGRIRALPQGSCGLHLLYPGSGSLLVWRSPVRARDDERGVVLTCGSGVLLARAGSRTAARAPAWGAECHSARSRRLGSPAAPPQEGRARCFTPAPAGGQLSSPSMR